MLVRSLFLRHLGAKLTPEQLHDQTPMVGRLRFEHAYYGGRDGRGAHVCLLMPDNPQLTDPIAQLHRAKVIKIEARGVLIRGEEDHWRRKERTSYPQVLWAWPAQWREPGF